MLREYWNTGAAERRNAGPVTVLSPQYSTFPVLQCSSVPAFKRSSVPAFQRSSFPALFRCSGVTGKLECRNAGILEHWNNTGTQDQRNARILEHRSSGTPQQWNWNWDCSIAPVFQRPSVPAPVAGGRSFHCSSIPVFQCYAIGPVLQKRLNAGTLEYWNIGITLEHKTKGTQDRWNTLGHWNNGEVERGNEGIMEHWRCSSVEAFRCSSVPGCRWPCVSWVPVVAQKQYQQNPPYVC